jgi:hypothetical protein
VIGMVTILGSHHTMLLSGIHTDRHWLRQNMTRSTFLQGRCKLTTNWYKWPYSRRTFLSFLSYTEQTEYREAWELEEKDWRKIEEASKLHTNQELEYWKTNHFLMRKDWKALKLKTEKTQAWIWTPFLGLVYFNEECDRRKDRERQRKKFSPGSMRTNTRLTWGLRAASKSASTPPYASPIKYMVHFGRTICSSFITASTCSNKSTKWFFTSSSSSWWVWSQTLSQDDMIVLQCCNR